jgi:hypothetical protein
MLFICSAGARARLGDERLDDVTGVAALLQTALHRRDVAKVIVVVVRTSDPTTEHTSVTGGASTPRNVAFCPTSIPSCKSITGPSGPTAQKL